jgi:transcriptional regulator with XRE-family HTH domain
MRYNHDIMRINERMTDAAALRELGSRIQRQRLDRNLTQQQLADQSEIARSTVARLEEGGGARLDVFLRVLRTLGLSDNLEALLPEPLPSPIEQLELQGRRRTRASGRRRQRDDKRATWEWGTP